MTPPKIRPVDSVKMISWNRVEDEKDLEVQDRLTGNFWLPEKIPLSNDVPSWSTLKSHGQQMTTRVFTGLTLLNAVQGIVGAISPIPDAVTPHKEAVFTNVALMESVHAKSCSSIFSALISTEEIDKIFGWSEESEYLQRKARITFDYYRGEGAEKRKMASTTLESFLFYSGLYAPMYWSAHAKLANTADLIRLITHDETVHGHYIGYKYQKALTKASQERRDELQECAYSLVIDLYNNEEFHTEFLYGGTGLTEDIKMFLRHNADKTLSDLGHGTLSGSDQTIVNPSILAALSPNVDENHDFFSGSGSSYAIDTAKAMTDNDRNF